MKLVIIIPAYNEEKTIADVINRIPQNINGISEKQVIVIDDGSEDRTVELAKQAGAFVFSHLKNSGVGKAFSTGIQKVLEARADIAITIDGDSQFNPQDIPILIQPILDGKADVVLGSRFIDNRKPEGISILKLFGNKYMARFVSRLSRQRFFDVSCGFRAYSKQAMLNLNLFGGFTYTQESILSLKFKNLNIKEVPVKARYFKDRKSVVSSNLFSYGWKAFKIIFQSIIDYKPFRFFGGIGASVFAIGVVFDLIMSIIFFQTGQFSPYKFIGVIGLSLNAFGLILLFIGLASQMLNRIRQTQEKILYFQKKKTYYG